MAGGKLTALAVTKARAPGMYGDGGGLYPSAAAETCRRSLFGPPDRFSQLEQFGHLAGKMNIGVGCALKAFERLAKFFRH
jgi:hypothetical protein